MTAGGTALVGDPPARTVVHPAAVTGVEVALMLQQRESGCHVAQWPAVRGRSAAGAVDLAVSAPHPQRARGCVWRRWCLVDH